ncbi:MAG: hypothetical protein WEA04_02900 [Candidatus Andersenbacteria bacterium]
MNDHDKDDDAVDYEEGSFFDRIKESPRTVSALIIILIVAAAIYAFSGNDDQGLQDEPGDQVAVTTQEPGTGEEEEAGTETTPSPGEGDGADVTSAPTTTPAAPSEPVTQEQLREAAQALPQARTTDNAYVEVAQAGDGITHLSRRAVTHWLAENQPGYSVTNEHRIYIEDYIQNRLGSERLEIGGEKSISFDLIREAVAAAGQLNEQQLRNLSQYTHALT